MMGMLTQDQAYAAMFHFLENHWQKTKSADIGGLLSDLSLLQDGSPADPAATNDWQKAVNYVLGGGQAGSLQLK